ncbi:mechanosensitive ion channel domain-containing protein [Persicobacter psychrovividus]|uniref:Mechanosensitive ion channel protein MscS n=1 Tax=Persicobacter psychrovividus TaxID=387638 RepID=A0ABM7VA48_9BACT|nr:mechanosensitive ion channel protein MscS [Persicobacter psychrovividus]
MNSTEIEIGLSILLLLIFFIGKRYISRFIKRSGNSHDYMPFRSVYVSKVITFLWAVLLIVVLGVIWEVSFQGLSVYIASIFTVVGVGFFAAWSILSNITSAMVLFFNAPFKIGDRIKIKDGDNGAEGEVIDINLFNIRIRDVDGNVTAYPNNLAMQKAIVKYKL